MASTAIPSSPRGVAPKEVTTNTRGIEIGGWSIKVNSGNIGNSAEMDALSDLLGIPPPEMAFPRNSLLLRHPESGFNLCFDAIRALRSVAGVKEKNYLEGMDCRENSSAKSPFDATVGAGSKRPTTGSLGEKPTGRRNLKSSMIKVAYAQEWGKKRNESSAGGGGGETGGSGDPPQVSSSKPSHEGGSNFGPDVAVAAHATGIASAKEYDWTYSSTWPGAIGPEGPQPLLPEGSEEVASGTERFNSSFQFQPGKDPSIDRIPVERLGPSSGEPILFYDDIVLYEDELADNGSSMVNVKVRVMPSGFLVLQRFFLRVDDVLFRVFETRVYCAFDKELVKRTTAKSISMLPSSTSGAGPTSSVQHAGSSQQTLPPTAQRTTPDLSGLHLGSPRGSRKRDSTPKDSGIEDEEMEREKFFPRVIRECSGCEATYAEVKACLPPYKPNDFTPLTDPNWVSSTLQSIARKNYFRASVNQATGKPTTSRETLMASSFRASSKGVGIGLSSGLQGDKESLAPTTAPGWDGTCDTGARIVEEIRFESEVAEGGDDGTDEDTTWQGIGGRVDVAVLVY
ncbi:TIP41-domain-containing protein [Violaceomyces palustris]|uniref:TIP41-domain-containing protein n=1 Tax=Violaceomyces palustris TaxID=1673888 RepID=A0ACD0P7P4_9BASI|nr:TIP41-domain-containing protein [Violaceomyces palustris]